jgi:hypothetical protein
MDNARVAGSSVFKKKLTTIQDYILAFAVAHKEQFIKDRYCFFGISKNFRKTNVQVHAHTTLSEIITHAQKENNRSRKVLQQLGWIDKECNVISPDIMRLLQQEREKGKERVIGQVAPK